MSIAFVYFLCYLLISSELLKSTNSKIMLKIRVHDSSAVTVPNLLLVRPPIRVSGTNSRLFTLNKIYLSQLLSQ
jgi:hypothetical protein